MTVIRKPTVIKPNAIKQKGDENTLTLHLQVDAEIEDFKGHFPQFALLPGVTQIDWAVHYAQQLFDSPKSFQSMEVIKFQEPILKDALVKLSLTWHADKQKLHFSYTSGQDDEVRTHSSGRILLA